MLVWSSRLKSVSGVRFQVSGKDGTTEIIVDIEYVMLQLIGIY